ncbi:hypothetical protein [Natrinema ejinorense]|uniref:hypothetical protein n=1 Tax=Natrinema ejinorense TaxID=373386 RepID=UPI00117E569B|nr:hypothetical protein [Natrinema ejinorense]
MASSKWSAPLITLCLALLFRLIMIPASLLQIHPYASDDAIGFAKTAALIATEFSLSTPRSSTYEIWGIFLAPFWILPGPSSIYAHIFVAILGAIAVYNIAVIGQTLYSPHAGVLAALPVAVYPSIVLTHSTLLREAAILFGLTTAARLLIARPPQLSRHWAAIGAVIAIIFTTIHRQENLPVYGLAILSAVTMNYWNHRFTKTTIVSFSISSLTAIPFLGPIIKQINNLRSHRVGGRTKYLGSVQFDGISEIIVFTWIGIGYFLFTPFPWMVETLSDVPIMFESLLSFFYLLFAIIGFRILINRSPSITVGLAVGFLFGVSLYGLGTVNYGTAVRHRPMFLWVIFVFGAVAITSMFDSKSLPFWFTKRNE